MGIFKASRGDPNAAGPGTQSNFKRVASPNIANRAKTMN